MADTYTQALKARKVEQNAYNNSYATRFNEDMVDVFDAAICGLVEIDIGSSTSVNLEALQNGTLSDSHFWRLKFIGTPASAVTVTVPASVTPSKRYLIDNQTGQALTFKYSATAGVKVPTGVKVEVYCDGADVVRNVGLWQPSLWTPSIQGSGTAGTYQIGASSALCRAVRSGRMVKLDVAITMAGTVTGGGTGYIQITNVPYTKINGSSPIGNAALVGVDFTTAGASLSLGFISSSPSTTLYIFETVDAGAGNNVPISGLGANDSIYGSIWFETDDP
jgi:hypothetical protein